MLPVRSSMKHLAKILIVCLTVSVTVGSAGFTATPDQLNPQVLAAAAGTAYLPTARDTHKPPEKITYDLTDLTGYETISENDNLIYSFREDRDIIAVTDKRSGYTWKTGLDLEFNNVIDDAIDAAATPEDKIKAAVPKEDRLNTTYIGFANSLLTVEYFDASQNIKLTSSAAQSGASSQLMTVDDDPTHRRLDVYFSSIDLTVALHIHLGEQGITYEIRQDEVSGAGKSMMAAFIISPFLGASGGQKVHYNPETDLYDLEVPNPITPGYVFIPDGPGSLIRFVDNTMSLETYTGSVYGEDLAQGPFYRTADSGMVPRKEPVMPVYGIAHGDRQAAFVAYAEQGAEYLELIVSPEENMTFYTFAYPRFVVNRLYHQIYNQKGDGYFSTLKQPNSFDLSMTYTFLHGDGSDQTPSADYIGMARAYRQALLDSDVLHLQPPTYDTTPIRFDFIMSDIKKGVLGYTNIVATTADDVGEILRDVQSHEIKNINVGLYGFQRGGVTGGKPWRASFAWSIGRAGIFQDLISEFQQTGVDISFAQDYIRINKLQMNLLRNWTLHVNSWGLKRMIGMASALPVDEISFASPTRMAEWLDTQTARLDRLGIASVTIDGMSEWLLSQNGNQPLTRPESAAIIAEAFAKVSEDHTVNAFSPGTYLWPYVDRFLGTPVFPTQYIIETDTVPFLQLVLHGTMELYAPYANFSFYTPQDVLRMIDYNVYPSFVLTRQPSYTLSSTNSSDFYSTEYSLYAPIIERVYKQVNDALAPVIGREWLGRTVLQDGVVVNRYSGGLEILVNYTSGSIDYRGVSTAAESCSIIRDGEG